MDVIKTGLSIGAILLSNMVFSYDSLPTVDDEAFSQVKESIAPMTPSQIKEIKDLFNEIQRASAYKEKVPPRPTSSSLVVDLQPGATPPVIRLGAGYVTSLVFLDSTGQPWPIKAYDIGNQEYFNVQWNQSLQDEENGDKMNNTLLIQAQTMFRDANLAVILRGMNTPVMISLIPGQRGIDYRVDMTIPQKGPYAKADIGGLPGKGGPELIHVLNQVAPQGAVPLKVLGGQDTKAYRYGDRLFVRTPYTIISPSWINSMHGPNGMIHAYELPVTSHILVTDQGQVRTLTLKDDNV